MALDLSGFTIPEQKFEGLYKLGEELSAQRKAKEAAKVAEAKAAKDAADKLQANQDLNFKLLSEATDPNKWLTGDPTDPQMLKEVRGINDAATKFLNENPGASSSQLRQFLYPQVSKWSEKQILIKKIDENIKDQVGKLNPSFYNTNEATKRMKEKFFYKEDENGNLVEKDINEIQIDPVAYDEVFKKYGHELVNARGVLNVINKIPKTQTTTQVGKTTTTVSLYPWQKNVNGVTSVDTEPVQMTDENGDPINVDVIKDDAYRALLAYAPETNDYLNAQLNLVSSELGREVDSDSQEGLLYKKKLMTELLGETGGDKFSRTTKVFAPGKGRSGGSAGEKEKAQKRARLADTINSRAVDADGYVDATDIFPGYKYGKKSFGRSGVKYNPDTQQFKLTVIDEDGTTSEEIKPFNEVYTIIQGSNSNKNLDALEGFLEVKPRGKNVDISKYDPAEQAGINAYAKQKKISIAEAISQLKKAGKIK